MKLIYVLLIQMIVMIESQKFSQNQNLFQSQFQTPSSFLSPERTIYLPADSQTPLPYYSINNMNKINYQFLPPSQTIAPPHFPTPLAIILSSTLKPNLNDDDDDDEQNIRQHHNTKPSFTLRDHINRTLTSIDRKSLEKVENVPNLRMYNNQAQIEKGRPDLVTIVNKETSSNFPNVQRPASRRMILTSEIQKPDLGPDLIKAGSFQKAQYIQAPSHILSTTTELAIPIIRLSNEMDLDGSFSYEALGADQTHYVQHSRMENMGTENEEQVVEGSYSYIGDDGRTYTVHYIADANGYRASGDHLPSPPPVPEIIQRAIQYNLAEEARKPPHLRNSWENEGNYDENKDEGKHNFVSLPPQRNLFTGKTPEAFSFSDNFIPKSNSATSRSNFHMQTKLSTDNMAREQMKSNTPITPQITFLASQGAHSPSLQQQSQPTIQKSTSDKSPLPQLMNYESDKIIEQEGNKPMWRWQYGYNANENQVPNKKSISRSFTEGDDVIINFNDMTPEQYSRMIQTQISETAEQSNKIEGDKGIFTETNPNSNPRTNINDSESSSSSHIYKPTSVTVINEITGNEGILVSTPKYDSFSREPNKYIITEDNNGIYLYSNSHTDIPDIRTEHHNTPSNIMGVHSLATNNQMVTQSYNFEETQFEPIKINVSDENPTAITNSQYRGESVHNKEVFYDHNDHNSTPLSTLYTNIYVTPYNYYQINEQNSFKPQENKPEMFTQETSTTESSVEQMLRENIFLKNLFKTPSPKETSTQEIPKSEDNDQYNLKNPEPTTDKSTKVIENKQSPLNEVRFANHKPLNLNDIFNYVIVKNHFESAKTKPKSKSTHFMKYNNNLNEKENSVRYIPMNENDKNHEEVSRDESKDYTKLNRQQQQELHGLIKNYKVLQRQKNAATRSQIMQEPQRHIKTFHSPGLPPLGRAGPSMKTYFPPTLQR